jgi:hypothetical protein
MEHLWSRAVATRGKPVANEETPKPTESGKNLRDVFPTFVRVATVSKL